MTAIFRSLSTLCLTFVLSCIALNTQLVISNAKVAPDSFVNEYVLVQSSRWIWSACGSGNGMPFSCSPTNLFTPYHLSKQSSCQY
jgi:hypothetical protein